MTFYRILPAFVALLALLFAGAGIAQEEPQVQQQDGISYVSGGIGDAGQAAMQTMAGDFNLHVTSAVEEGNYLADVQIQIMDTQGDTVLDTNSQGPLFYASLPPGDYTVMASGFGQSQQESVRIGQDSPASVVLHWDTPGPEGNLDAVSPDSEGKMSQ